MIVLSQPKKRKQKKYIFFVRVSYAQSVLISGIHAVLFESLIPFKIIRSVIL